MKKIILILCLVCFMHCFAYAQGAGYLGRHLIIRTDIQTNTTFFVRAYWDDLVFFNKSHSFGIDYLITNRISAGLSYRHFRSRFDFKEKFDYWVMGVDSRPRQYTFFSNVIGDIIANSFSANLKIYRLNNLAPVETYLKFDLAYVPYKLEYDIVELLKSTEFQMLPAKWINARYSDIFFGMGIGYQRVFWERFITNLAVLTQISLGGTDYYISDYTRLNYLDTTNYLKYVTAKSLLLQSIIGFEAGIGVLLF